jgi:outer membrane protein OmpA-like peptidoglycan-associated protein
MRGTLHRVEKTAGPVPVIVNGRPVRLPAIHAKGTLGVDECEFYFLDDPDNPIALRFTIVKDSLTVTSINYPGATEMTASSAVAAAGGSDGGQGIEQSLAATGHADVYGIYFAFNSDLIRPESEAVLKEIAALLVKHPDWRLNVDGHTDGIGGAAPNLLLSTRRAAAVKKALVDRYHVAPGRLATAGFGLSRPKAPNDTLEGRALNRRVELVRQ